MKTLDLSHLTNSPVAPDVEEVVGDSEAFMPWLFRKRRLNSLQIAWLLRTPPTPTPPATPPLIPDWSLPVPPPAAHVAPATSATSQERLFC